jgi:tetratricopeptide (TPR) repeat protein
MQRMNVAELDLDELWDFDRPDLSEERFRAALATADAEGAAVLRTQLARALGLQRRFEEGHAELEVVIAGTPLVRTYHALERGRLLRSAGQPEDATPLFETALAEAEAAGLDHLAADAAHMLAITASGEAEIPWAERALAVAQASADPRARRWVASITHNLGWTMHELGRHEEALALFEQALAARQERGEAKPIHIARWTVARELRALGRLDEALAIQRDLAEHSEEDGYVHEELAELLLASGRGEEAKPHFARAHDLLAADEWLAEAEPARIARLADLAA